MTRRNQEGGSVLHRPEPPSPDSLGATIGFLKPVTYRSLVEKFGKPLLIPEPEEADGRIQVIWKVLWEDGAVNEIYDYKAGPFWLGPMEGVHYTKVTEWDVSGDERGYERFVAMFGVESDPVGRVTNKRRRPDIAAELLGSHAFDTITLKRRLMR